MRVAPVWWLQVCRVLGAWISRWLLAPGVCPNQFARSKTSAHAERQIFKKKRESIRGSIVASISARHADDPGSIPGRGGEGAIAHMCGSPAPVCMVTTY